MSGFLQAICSKCSKPITDILEPCPSCGYPHPLTEAGKKFREQRTSGIKRKQERLEACKYGLEMVTTQHFSSVGEAFQKVLEDLIYYNSLTGVESPLFDLKIIEKDVDRPWMEYLRDILPSITRAAKDYHYYAIQQKANEVEC